MRPQVVAHRGGSTSEAEHTLGAYVAALDSGADALECDVRLTADGHLVCVHDRDLRRVAGQRGIVSTMELSDLADLDVTRGRRPWQELEDDDVPDRDERMDRVLTLRTLLDTVRDYDRRVEVAIETKHPTRYAGLVERRLTDVLADFDWTKAGAPVRVMSFSYTALQRVERLAPEVQLVQLMERAAYWPMLRRVVGPHWWFCPGIRELREHRKLARRIRRAGHELHVWTVNTEEDVDVCLEAGASAIITDRPAYVKGLLDQRGL
jgi:glycerophosphoryl diester phosphodiesterase